MKRRSLFLCMAAGLVASLAFATPSQAGSTIVDTKVTFLITGPNSPTITDFSIQYAGVPALDPIGPITVITTGGLTTLTVLENPVGSGLIVITFDRTNETVGFGTGSAQTLEFQFSTPATGGTVSGTFAGMSNLDNPPVTGQHFNINVNSTPEPASLALLGIGMTGFLAFRRFFKKTSVA